MSEQPDTDADTPWVVDAVVSADEKAAANARVAAFMARQRERDGDAHAA
ncbi:hypothetical protein ACTD5D_39950 [Nocardia takedensis]